MSKIFQRGNFIREEDAPAISSKAYKKMIEYISDKEAQEIWDKKEEITSWTHQKIRAKRAT